MSGRYLRTLRHLALTQIAHRLRLRGRMAFRAGGFTGRRTVAAPPLRVPPPPPPVGIVRPCAPEVVRRCADDAGKGAFRHLSSTRYLPEAVFPPPADAPRLWAFEHEYMECLFDLALHGRWEAAQRLLRARLAVDDRPGPAGLHPYTEARRTAVLCRLCGLAGAGTPALVRDAAFAGACRVEANLEHDVGGNHLLEGGLALTLAGAAFRGRRASGFLDRGLRILAGGLASQVRADGGHYEGSAMYHARVLGVLAEGALAASAAGRPAAGSFVCRLAAMCAFLDGVLAPGGELPLLGDSVRDDRLSPAMLIRAVAEVLPVPVPRPTAGDRAWPDSGFFVFDDREAGHRLIFDGGPVCPERLPAHGQADTFTFELWVAGQPLVVDSGVFEYAPGEMRDYCRSTRAHNTVEVDGEDSAEVWGAFRVGRRGAVRATWRCEGGRGEVGGRHAGYRHRGIEVARTASHLSNGVWLLGDRVRGRRAFSTASRIQFAPGAEVIRPEPDLLCVNSGSARLWVRVLGRGELRMAAGWHCPRFGVRERTVVAEVHDRGPDCGGGFLLVAGGDRAPAGRLDDGFLRVAVSGRRWTRALP